MAFRNVCYMIHIHICLNTFISSAALKRGEGGGGNGEWGGGGGGGAS